MRSTVDPAGPCLLERPKTIICRPVQTLARPPSFGAMGAFGSSRQLPARGLVVVAPALATAAGAITSARANAIRFIVVAPSGRTAPEDQPDRLTNGKATANRPRKGRLLRLRRRCAPGRG